MGEMWEWPGYVADSVLTFPDGPQYMISTAFTLANSLTMERLSLCVNTLDGVPDAVLESPTEAESLCLAVLRGGREDGTVIAAAADELAARVTGGEGYVSRADLLGWLRMVLARNSPHAAAAVANGRDHFWGWAVDEHEALAALLDRADPGGPRHDGRDGG